MMINMMINMSLFNTWLRFLAIHMFILNCEYVSIME